MSARLILHFRISFLFILLFSFSSLSSLQDVEEKLEEIDKSNKEEALQQTLKETNEKILAFRQRVRQLQTRAKELSEQTGREEEVKRVVGEMKHVRKQIRTFEEEWHDLAGNRETEEYGLWHQPKSTVEDLIAQYGAQEDVYMIPEEIGSLKISLSSQLSIPQSSWSELLEWVLAENGVGIKQLNPYLKQLHWLSNAPSSLTKITDQRDELALLAPHARVCFIVTPAAEYWNETKETLERLSDEKEVKIQISDRSIFLISRVDIILELLRICDFMGVEQYKKEYKILYLSKLQSSEVEPVLERLSLVSKRGESQQTAGLQIATVMSQPQLLLLFGQKEQIQKAESVVHQMENELGESKEKIIYWYTCRYTDPEELAEVLQQVYALLQRGNVSSKGQKTHQKAAVSKTEASPEANANSLEKMIDVQQELIHKLHQSRRRSSPKKTNGEEQKDRGNFIVDKKTGTILLVVEKELLGKLQEVIKKLDIPKKMVHIEVLLFEKKVTQEDSFGLTLMNLGKEAGTVGGGAGWRKGSKLFGENTRVGGEKMFHFFFSGKNRLLSSHNFAYNFLLGQTDIQIHSTPSIMTTNKTAAKISIVEERSIQGSVVSTTSGQAETSYERKEFGTTIEMTPCIHLSCEEGSDENEEGEYLITLQTKIEFDDFDNLTMENQNRPEVTKRRVSNEVCIPSGQTVIIGGLRRKHVSNAQEMVPFLGEIPGIGKFFSYTGLKEDSKEMVIFITPRVVNDSKVEREKQQRELLQKRPGDLPSLLERINRAKTKSQGRLFDHTLNSLFGKTVWKEE